MLYNPNPARYPSHMRILAACLSLVLFLTGCEPEEPFEPVDIPFKEEGRKVFRRLKNIDERTHFKLTEEGPNGIQLELWVEWEMFRDLELKKKHALGYYVKSLINHLKLDRTRFPHQLQYGDEWNNGRRTLARKTITFDDWSIGAGAHNALGTIRRDKVMVTGYEEPWVSNSPGEIDPTKR